MSASRTSAASSGHVVAVVMLDRGGELLRQAPAARHHAADQGVVDSELAPLCVDALLRRASRLVDLCRVAGVGLNEHELADVVQQRGDQELVSVGKLDPRAEPVRRALRRNGVQAEALRGDVPHGVRSKKSKVLVAPISASTPAGVSTSIACGMLRTFPRLSACLFASRITAITSATSDSIAVTISATEGWSWLTTRRTRLRDSASAGKPRAPRRPPSAAGRAPRCAGGPCTARCGGLACGASRRALAASARASVWRRRRGFLASHCIRP